jgi:AraC-like DNA-binding protein
MNTTSVSSEDVSVHRSAHFGGIDLMRVSNSHRLWRLMHDTFDVVNVTSGDASFQYRGKFYPRSARSVLLLEPCEISVDLRGSSVPRTFEVLMFRPSVAHRLHRQVAGRAGLRMRTPLAAGDERLRRICQRLSLVIQEEDSSAVEGLALELFTHLFTHYADPSPLPARSFEPSWVNDVLDFIHSRLTEKITVGTLTELVGARSQHQFVRSFRTAVGVAPHEYIVALRVARARTLLSAGVSCAETAAACGFPEQSLLNRQFTKAMGITPGAWARANRDAPTPVPRSHAVAVG